MDMLDPVWILLPRPPPPPHDKGPEAEEGVELQEGGDGPGAEEQTAVAIASVQQAAFGDHNIQYQFRTENNGGQVTYRVVQVTDGQLDGQGDAAGAVSVVSTAAFAGGQQAVTQVGVDGASQRPGPAAASVPPGPAAPFPLAVIQNPFSNGGSPAAEAVSGEARFAYFPASSVGDTTAVSVQTTDQSLQAGGQFYVMMTPQDVLQTGTQRTIAPRTHPYSPKIDGTRTPRDERRRAQHNEVERRRRDKINNWIVQLSKIIPDCHADNSKTGASKGGILSKACDYIRELRQTNQRMQETFKEAERLQMDNELLRQQIEELKNENALLRAQLQQHNLEMPGQPEALQPWHRTEARTGMSGLSLILELTASPKLVTSRGGHWGAWMPSSISAFEGTCVSIPCRFDFPDELRPAVVHGVWYFNSPYPKNYPPVVFKSRTQVVHESFQGRSRLLGDLGLRNCTLLLSTLSPELGGKYYFRGDLGGYNQYTFSEHSVLDIINTPNIVVPPEVVAGSEVEVSCMVPDNCPELRPELSWLGHEGLGEPTVLGRLREDEGTWVQVSLLHFVPTREANGHRLGCQAAFPNTTLQFEGYASLDVKYPPVIVEMNSSVEAIEGSHVSLLCGADSNPPPLLTWMRDGMVLSEAVAESLYLDLEEVTPGEDGVYACLAENAYGQDNRTVELSVMYAPRKPMVNGTVVAVEGETISILCSTQSNPDPILTIFKEKQILATVIYESQLQLELPAVTPEDDGEYWCVAENQYGQTATAFNLSVE
ncbi:hypothetical protein STEG23_024871, partial [Scotinomys teguina]